MNKETTCQAETVLKGILKANIRGGIYIKDSDNIFEQKLSFLNKNQITTIDSKVELLDAKINHILVLIKWECNKHSRKESYQRFLLLWWI